MRTVGRFGAGWVTSFHRPNDQNARAARRRSMDTTLEHERGTTFIRLFAEAPVGFSPHEVLRASSAGSVLVPGLSSFSDAPTETFSLGSWA